MSSPAFASTLHQISGLASYFSAVASALKPHALYERYYHLDRVSRTSGAAEARNVRMARELQASGRAVTMLKPTQVERSRELIDSGGYADVYRGTFNGEAS